MVFFKIAIGSLLKRKRRVVGIGLLVMFGTILIVFGQEFALTANTLSKQAIIKNLTGDFIVYSARSKEKPGPYTFSNPLSNIENVDEIKTVLSGYDEVEAFTAYAQNISVIAVEKEDGTTSELPLIYSAVEPETYLDFFRNIEMTDGTFFKNSTGGIVISEAQNGRYEEQYGVRFAVGDPITMYGITSGGAVNAVKTTVRGIFVPIKYENSFDYINFMDMATYSELYNFTGVAEGSLPEDITETLLTENEDDIFGLASEEGFGIIDVGSLESAALSGFTMIAVHLNEGVDTNRYLETLQKTAKQYGFKTAPWDEASGGLARISGALQGFIYAATALIFIIVALILMNTLIINIMERTSEIGTIRAIGAKKSFVTLMFLSETLVLNVIAGIAGIAVSAVLILIAGRIGIALPGPVSQFLIGGGRLYPTLSLSTVGQALLIIVVITILATLYPLRVATRVTPLVAMSEGN
ncbi:MAG: ABC transporter permease [Spirochaetes bacterium]|nr:ABC transporter permease [Spirochaetota bacterium]